MRTKHWLIAVSLVLFGFAAYWFIDKRDSPKHSEFREHCSELKEGMTRQQVEFLVGRPRTISFHMLESRTIETWCYDCRSILAAPYLCAFDSSSGLLTKVLCGE